MDAVVLVCAIIIVLYAALYIQRLTDRHDVERRYQAENDDLDKWMGGV